MFKRIRTWFAEERGSVAVETALAVPFLAAATLAAVDMHSIGLERTRLEEGAGSVALNVAAQKKLTRPALDALIDAALQEKTRDTEVLLYNVKNTGVITWLLRRGDGAALCQWDADGIYYTGELPEDAPAADDAGNEETDGDTATASMVVVKVCKRTSGLKKWLGIKAPDVMRTESIFRAGTLTIALDDELADENLVEPEDDDEDSAS